MASSSARMEVFECPICAPKRYFVTEIGLRTHVADRHPWRSLPPAQQRIPPTKAVMPEPAWLRERQGAAARSELNAGYPSYPSGRQQQRDANNPTNAAVTFDTQSLLSDEVFFDDGSGGGGGRQVGQQPAMRQQRQYQNPRQQPQRHQQNYDPSLYTDDRYPPPDYDPPMVDLVHAVDSVDSSARKKRELATSRRPWYDSDDYAGPRNLMEKPGGYYQFDEVELNGPGRAQPPKSGYSKQRMHRELDDRDSHIETLRLEIDRLWDERMRLLKVEAERTRVVKDQAYGLQPLRQLRDGDGAAMHSFRLGRDHEDRHAFQPVLPHSRLQLHRARDYPPDRRAIDY